MDLPVPQRDGQRSWPDQVVSQPKFFNEADGVAVASKEVVIELVEPHPGLDLESRREPSGERLPLDQDHLVAAQRQPVRDGQAEGAGPEHGSAGHVVSLMG